MKNALSIFGLTLLALATMDVSLAGILWATKGAGIGPVDKLRERLELGQSVPGKHARWAAAGKGETNIFRVGWRGDVVARSAALFGEEVPGERRVRAYGMSFSNHLTRAYGALPGSWPIDLHSGQGGPINYSFSLFRDDRANRNQGDVVVLGVLASSLYGAMSLSNRIWTFDQPAPMTCPIFLIGEDGLTEIAPVINDWRAELDAPASAQAEWQQQLKDHDVFFTDVAYIALVLDVSPFLSSVRRALVTSEIAKRKAELLTDPDRRARLVGSVHAILTECGRATREDGQTPFVILIQDRVIPGLNLERIAGDLLQAQGVAFLDTADVIDPTQRSFFQPDGHFTAAADQIMAARMKAILDDATR